MTDEIATALEPYCPSPPQDLLLHFRNGPFLDDSETDVHLMPLDDALSYTSALHQNTSIARVLGLVAIEDADNSDPYCYVTRGPAAGAILHLCHDGDTKIAFASLGNFTRALNVAIESEISIWDLPHDSDYSVLDQAALSAHVRGLPPTEDAAFTVCLLMPTLPTADIELMTYLSCNEDFFVRESLAILIARSPHSALLPVATKLMHDPHAQVARPGKSAFDAVTRVINNVEP